MTDRTGTDETQGVDARHQGETPAPDELGVRDPEGTRTLPANTSRTQHHGEAREEPAAPHETTEPG